MRSRGEDSPRSRRFEQDGEPSIQLHIQGEPGTAPAHPGKSCSSHCRASDSCFLPVAAGVGVHEAAAERRRGACHQLLHPAPGHSYAEVHPSGRRCANRPEPSSKGVAAETAEGRSQHVLPTRGGMLIDAVWHGAWRCSRVSELAAIPVVLGGDEAEGETGMGHGAWQLLFRHLDGGQCLA